ncbi:hypothetical protein TNCV_1473221 [Trichonephila clavipes]|nr:hypothetical protein TNCV_1473221 [Trichonephila clavipes]
MFEKERAREYSIRLYLRESDKRLLLSDKLESQQYLSTRSKVDFEPRKFRISNCTVVIEPASSPKLGVELPRRN